LFEEKPKQASTKNIFLLILLIFSQLQIFAQSSNYIGTPYIQSYSPKNYQADPQNWDAVQDKRGVMYFANTGGVLQFDGNNWVLLRVSNYSLVRSLAIDSTQTIYVGAIGELGYLCVTETGKLNYKSLLDEIPDQYRKFTDVWKIFADKSGVYFITDNKIFCWHNQEMLVFEGHQFQYTFQVGEKLFILSEDGFYYIENQEIKSLPLSENFYQDVENCVILPFSENQILMAFQNKGFYLYNLEILAHEGSIPLEERAYFFSLAQEFETQLADFVRYNGLETMKKVADNLFVVATKNAGLVFMNEKGEFLQSINKKTGLSNNTVHNVFVDNNQSFWLCLDEGIANLETISPIQQFNFVNGIDGVVLSTIQNKGKRYVGTSQGIYTCAFQKSVNQQFKPIFNVKEQAWNFLALRNRLFVALSSGMAEIEDGRAKKLFDFGKTYCFAQSLQFPNYIFVGLYRGLVVLEIVEQEDGKFSLEFRGSYKNIKEPIWNIESDNFGNLWLSTLFSGLIHIKFTGKNWDDYKRFNYGTDYGLPKQLNNLYVHHYNGIIYAATPIGIYKTEVRERNQTNCQFQFDSLLNRQFPKGSSFSQFFIDKKGRFWINGNTNISLLFADGNKFIKQNVPFHVTPTYIHAFSLEDSLLWVCSNEGLFSYNPEKKVSAKKKFQTLVTQVVIGTDSLIFEGQFYQPDSFDGLCYLKFSPVQHKKQIPVIDYDFNSLSFEFSASSFEKGSGNAFKFMLEGFDTDWSEWTHKTHKGYTNLRPGTYTFRLKSKNIFDVEGAEATYSFVVKSPWSRTWWAYIFYIILIISFLYLSIKIYSRRLMAINERLERLVNERTKLVEAQKTELVKQSQQLQKLSLVASETDNAIMIMDKNGDFEWVNESFTRMFGYTLAELIAEKSKNIVGPHTSQEVKDLITECIKSKKSIGYEFSSTSRYGNQVWVQATISPILNEAGEIVNLVGIDSDISKVKAAERESHQKSEELELQKEKLERQNFNIRASIRYAQTIQKAILPTEKELNNEFETFVLFRPKDIVSGDFTWFSRRISQMTFVAVIDCTGHGVPGAFMSMIGNRILNEIVNEKKIIMPHEILETMNLEIVAALKQEETDNNDGMDVCICRFEQLENGSTRLFFSGAKRPLFYYKRGSYKLETLSGDRKSIGGRRSKNYQIPFTTQELILNKGDLVYLTSDGIVDQNAPNRKRFGTRRFVNTLFQNRNNSMEAQLDLLSTALDEFQDGELQRDDITVLGLKIQ